MASNTTIPPSSIRSWNSIVRAADPDYDKEKMHPWVYEFSSGRKFVDKADPYSTP